MRSGLDQPGAFGDEDLDAVLHAVGTATVGGLLQTPAHPAAVSVGFSPAPPPVSSPLSLPIAAPLLVRDADVSILQLLADSYEVRSRLEPLGLERAMTQPLPRREPLPVVWVVPAELFDDPDWPGAEPDMSPSEARAARRSSAGGWLAAQGIALATAPT
jgi:hypothetical protein